MRLILEPPTHSRRIRGSDAKGSGAWGAKRTKRRPDGQIIEYQHEGVDYLAEPGEEGLSAADGYVIRCGYPYEGDPEPRYRLIVVDAGPAYVALYYVRPVALAIGQLVARGQVLGITQDIRQRYGGLEGGMGNHVHLQVRLKGAHVAGGHDLVADPGLWMV